ncbi:MAG: hypothetical protein L0J06_12070, partial [Yaniella sp.]|nr:hypothetical protein [Yaniella sp.]
MNTRQALREQLHALWATAGCFLVGATLGFITLRGAPSAFIGTGSIAVKTAIISAAVASLAFIISTVFYRR